MIIFDNTHTVVSESVSEAHNTGEIWQLYDWYHHRRGIHQLILFYNSSSLQLWCLDLTPSKISFIKFYQLFHMSHMNNFLLHYIVLNRRSAENLYILIINKGESIIYSHLYMLGLILNSNIHTYTYEVQDSYKNIKTTKWHINYDPFYPPCVPCKIIILLPVTG